jgi:hypothetical protein
MRLSVVVLALSFVLCPVAKAQDASDGGRGVFPYLGLGWLGESGGERLLIRFDDEDDGRIDVRLSPVPTPPPREPATERPQPSFSLVVIWRF